MILTALRTPWTLLAVAAGFALMGEARAARPAAHVRGADQGGLQLVDGRPAPKRGAVMVGRRSPAGAMVSVAHQARAMSRLDATLGRSWATWDDTTGVPRRIMTAGAPAPDAVANPWQAARIARHIVATHLDALAPGSAPSDFVEVVNHEAGGMRSVGFVQYSEGREVIGGQLSIRFKHDRLVGIGSEALPFVSAPVPARRVDETTVTRSARDWVQASTPGHITTVGAVEGPFVLPVLDPAATRPSYHEVFAVDVRVTGPDSGWRVFLDSETGDPIAREQTLTFASGVVGYQVPLRSPSFGPRETFPARGVELLVDGGPQLTDALGTIVFDTPTATVETGLEGPLQRIVNASGDLATTQLFVADGGSATWDAADDPAVESQMAAFVHAGIVKEYIRGIDPTFEFLDQQLRVTVNIDDDCNAFSDGDSINFFLASEACENTGLIADVVYHEFGHSVHRQSLIPGVGAFDGSLSEGVSDYLSATITGDSGLARGFFYSDAPLREIDPDDFEFTWPEGAGEVHAAGQIISGALWDLRTALIEKYGAEEGVRLTDRIYYEATRRAVDMPSMHPEALLVDDDDGDLSNGTPNGCEINAAFGAHGLFSAGTGAEAVTLVEAPEGYRVDLQLALPSFPDCPVSATASLEYRVRGTTESTEVAMDAVGGGFAAAMPASAVGEVLQYRVRVDYSVGTQHSLPDNRADPWYETFVGPVDELFCVSFEGDSGNGWGNGDGFSVGAPAGNGSPVDPPSAYDDDDAVLGHSLSGDGFYSPWSSHSIESPPIRFAAAGYDSIRLQYFRWLTVEDGHFDQAQISVDDELVWENFISPDEKAATTHHTDREWRFHDIDITDHAADGEVVVQFSLETDGGLELGGWTVDALCVVGVGTAAATCGDGVVDPGEQCDDGNAIDGDGCSSACALDAGTDGDDGPDSAGDDAADDDGGSLDGEDGLVGRGCGCTSRHGNVPGPAGWLLALAIVGLRRRRA